MRHGHVAKLAEWAKEYGDVFRVSIGSREVVCSLPCTDPKRRTWN